MFYTTEVTGTTAKEFINLPQYYTKPTLRLLRRCMVKSKKYSTPKQIRFFSMAIVQDGFYTTIKK
jgi:hypothetical protein